MKKFIFQSVLLIVVIAAAFFFFTSGMSISSLPFQSGQPAVKRLQVGNAQFNVEVADTQEKRSKGLGGRESLASDSGMLFIFSGISRPPFWMKGLSFALDFVWIRDGKVVDLTQNAPPPAPNQPDSSLPIYQSKEDVDRVLEVNGGTVQRLNIKVGDTVKVP